MQSTTQFDFMAEARAMKQRVDAVLAKLPAGDTEGRGQVLRDYHRALEPLVAAERGGAP